jgi:flagellar hook-length control protein FliK
MMKEMINTLPQTGPVGTKTTATEGTSDQMLMKLLGQGKLTSEEKSLLDSSQADVNFSELLALGAKEGKAVEQKTDAKKVITIGQPLEINPEQNLLGEIGVIGKDNSQLSENKETNGDVKTKKHEIKGDINNPLLKILGNNTKNPEAGKIVPADTSLLLTGEAHTKLSSEKTTAKKGSSTSAQNLNQEQNMIEMTSPSIPKAAQKSAMKQFAKEQNNIGGSLLKFKRDASEEEKNKVELKTEQTRSEWIDQMTQKSEPKMATATALNAKNDVLDLSSIQANNRTELISKISNYIEQNAVRSEDGLDLKVKHEDLGHIKIKVQRGVQGDVNLNMITDSVEATKFLKANESELLGNLSQSGIKLGDFKIVTGSDSMAKLDQSSDFNMNRDSKGQPDSQNRFSQGQNDQGREKRRELWERMAEQRAA